MNELCEVCQRVAWGEVARLGFKKWRHDACYPGSAAWLEHFRMLPEREKTEEGKLIYAASMKEAVSIGLVQTITEGE